MGYGKLRHARDFPLRSERGRHRVLARHATHQRLVLSHAQGGDAETRDTDLGLARPMAPLDFGGGSYCFVQPRHQRQRTPRCKRKGARRRRCAPGPSLLGPAGVWVCHGPVRRRRAAFAANRT